MLGAAKYLTLDDSSMVICYLLLFQLVLIGVYDVIIGILGKPMITDAVRQINAESGWLLAGAMLILWCHFFLLPKAISLWTVWMVK